MNNLGFFLCLFHFWLLFYLRFFNNFFFTLLFWFMLLLRVRFRLNFFDFFFKLQKLFWFLTFVFRSCIFWIFRQPCPFDRWKIKAFSQKLVTNFSYRITFLAFSVFSTVICRLMLFNLLLLSLLILNFSRLRLLRLFFLLGRVNYRLNFLSCLPWVDNRNVLWSFRISCDLRTENKRYQ